MLCAEPSRGPPASSLLRLRGRGLGAAASQPRGRHHVHRTLPRLPGGLAVPVFRCRLLRSRTSGPAQPRPPRWLLTEHVLPIFLVVRSIVGCFARHRRPLATAQSTVREAAVVTQVVCAWTGRQTRVGGQSAPRRPCVCTANPHLPGAPASTQGKAPEEARSAGAAHAHPGAVSVLQTGAPGGARARGTGHGGRVLGGDRVPVRDEDKALGWSWGQPQKALHELSVPEGDVYGVTMREASGRVHRAEIFLFSR